MAEDCDVFAKLDAFCNNNLLATFRSSVAVSDNTKTALSIDSGAAHPPGVVNTKAVKDSTALSKRLQASSKEKIAPPPPSSTKTKATKQRTASSRKKASSTESHAQNGPTTETEQNVSISTTGRRRSLRLMNKQPEVPSENIIVTNNPSTRRRGARSAALTAASSAVIDYIDLVSSPVPEIKGVIVVDSDEEPDITYKKCDTGDGLNLSFDHDNPEFLIKVMWNGHPESFTLRKYQKFACIFETIAKREKTDVNNMVFNIDNKIVRRDDTPASIDYKVFQFIVGRVISDTWQQSPHEKATKKASNPNVIQVKVLSDRWKKPLMVDLLKTDPFNILYIKCAEELNVPIKQFKLSFDGDTVEMNLTPIDLDLEGGEAIDLHFMK